MIARSNYFIGTDPRRWTHDVPHYGQVEYRGVYPGVDVLYYGKQRQLEYDFRVAPGADPSRIRLEFEGVRSMRINSDGDLILATADGELTEHKPIVYQQVNGSRVSVEGSSELLISSRDLRTASEIELIPSALVRQAVAGQD